MPRNPSRRHAVRSSASMLNILRGTEYRTELYKMPLMPYAYPKPNDATYGSWLEKLTREYKKEGCLAIRSLTSSRERKQLFDWIDGDNELQVWLWWLIEVWDPKEIKDPHRRDALPGYSGQLKDLPACRRVLTRAKKALSALAEIEDQHCIKHLLGKVRLKSLLAEIKRLLIIATRPKNRRMVHNAAAWILVLFVDLVQLKGKFSKEEALEFLSKALPDSLPSQDTIDDTRNLVRDWMHGIGQYKSYKSPSTSSPL